MSNVNQTLIDLNTAVLKVVNMSRIALLKSHKFVSEKELEQYKELLKGDDIASQKLLVAATDQVMRENIGNLRVERIATQRGRGVTKVDKFSNLYRIGQEVSDNLSLDLVMWYEGSNDNGDTEGVAIEIMDNDKERWENIITTVEILLDEEYDEIQIDDLIWDYIIDHFHPNFWNGSGGRGIVRINLIDTTCLVDHSDTIIDYENTINTIKPMKDDE